jgi:response regulator RpfG family c-di-GMP phosphodiesterase
MWPAEDFTRYRERRPIRNASPDHAQGLLSLVRRNVKKQGNARPGPRSQCYRVDMVRPCFLVIDREFPGSISTRKLVIETAKFNVITSYSAREAIETLKTFPALHGVVLDSEVPGMPCESLVNELKSINAAIPIIAVCGPGDHPCTNADHQLESFEPRVLLELLRKLLLTQTVAIEKHEEELHRDQ